VPVRRTGLRRRRTAVRERFRIRGRNVESVGGIGFGFEPVSLAGRLSVDVGGRALELAVNVEGSDAQFDGVDGHLVGSGVLAGAFCPERLRQVAVDEAVL
jgi:hypothetical protein